MRPSNTWDSGIKPHPSYLKECGGLSVVFRYFHRRGGFFLFADAVDLLIERADLLISLILLLFGLPHSCCIPPAASQTPVPSHKAKAEQEFYLIIYRNLILKVGKDNRNPLWECFFNYALTDEVCMVLYPLSFQTYSGCRAFILLTERK